MSKLDTHVSIGLSTSSLDPFVPNPPKTNYKDELIFAFYSAMLEVVVDNSEPDISDEPVSISSGEKVVTSKSYTEICNEDMNESTPYLVEGSTVSFVKKLSAECSATSKLSKKVQKPKRKSRKSLISEVKFNKSVNLVKTESVLVQPEDTTWMVEPVEEKVIIHFSNGNVYQGPIFRKVMHGKGTFVWSDGTKYVGDFKNGELTGYGTMHYPDNSWYRGEFFNGYRHGVGSLLIAHTPKIYNGTWNHGQKHGHGWILYAPGNWYEGKWVNDLMHGCGLRQYPSGSRYHGLWDKGLRHGFGSAIMKNSDFFTGSWKKGKRSGYGEYTWKSFYNQTFSFPVENKYRGAWENDIRHGVGVTTFGMDGGARYAGCYQNNFKHGAGIIICENSVSIESNPLFLKDKPVHLTDEGSLNCLPEDRTTCMDDDEFGEVAKSKECIANTQMTSDISITSEMTKSKSVGLSSTFHMISKQARVFSVELDNTVLANIELCKLKFPHIKSNFLSLSIPILTPSDLICFSYYIDKVVHNYDGFDRNMSNVQETQVISVDNKELLVFTPKSTSSPKQCPTMISFKRSAKDYDSNASLKIKCSFTGSELAKNEEKCLRKYISTVLYKLHSIYDQYAKVGCLRNVPFKPLLIRLFLWQLYRDCKIPEKGLSLAKIDELLSENPETQIEYMHDPFEMIYFSQFLHSFVGLSWTLYGCECLLFFEEGILCNALMRFLENDIFPNYGHHTGRVLFDYLDLLPLDYVYQWYKSFGEPVTALQFLRSICQISENDPTDTNIENVFIINGLNAVPLGQNLIYLEEDIPDIQTEPSSEKFKTFDADYFKLHFLRELGAPTLVALLHKLCPHMIEDKHIINMEYPLTFLEFYEVILLSAQEIFNRREKQAEEARIAEEERIEREAREILKYNESISSSKKSRQKKIMDRKKK